jgi:CheY-like chemotaxis protein
MAKRILVVEDDADNRRILETLLRHDGYDVAGVGDGFEAIEECLRQRPDLVLLDLDLPRLDGWQTVRRLKALPGFASVPFVAVTAQRLRRHQERARAAGCVDWLPKPCRIADVRESVRKWLGGTTAFEGGSSDPIS